MLQTSDSAAAGAVEGTVSSLVTPGMKKNWKNPLFQEARDKRLFVYTLVAENKSVDEILDATSKKFGSAISRGDICTLRIAFDKKVPSERIANTTCNVLRIELTGKPIRSPRPTLPSSKAAVPPGKQGQLALPSKSSKTSTPRKSAKPKPAPKAVAPAPVVKSAGQKAAETRRKRQNAQKREKVAKDKTSVESRVSQLLKRDEKPSVEKSNNIHNHLMKSLHTFIEAARAANVEHGEFNIPEVGEASYELTSRPVTRRGKVK